MEKIDKTKDNIGITKLDNKTRKELFEKFIDSGGKVIEEKAPKKPITINRENQKKLQKRSPGYPDKNIKKAKPKTTETKPVQPARTPTNRDINSFLFRINKLTLRFKLKFLGITGFNGRYFTNKFFNKFNTVYKPALMEIQILYFEIFRKNLSIGKNITGKLDRLKPQYFELIEMTGNIFDKIIADQIIEQYINFPDVLKKVSELREPLLQLMKKIYILSPYENSILTSFERAVDLYAKSGESISDSPSAIKRKMRSDIFIIFHKLFPRLHLLFSLYQGRSFKLYEPGIETILSITDAEKPGKRVLDNYLRDMPSQTIEADKGKTPDEETAVKDDARQQAIKKGLEMMSLLDLIQLRNEYDKTGLFENVSGFDKVLITYLLLNEFDREYSCILTTNKIKYRTDVISRVQKDFKADLIHLYDKMKKSVDSLKEYLEELKSYEKARGEKPVNSIQYIEYTKRLEALEKRKNIIGKNALAVVRAYMNEIAQEFKILVEDMDTHQLHIDNPQEELVFDPLIEGEKKINNKKIYEAVRIVYSYASAFVYRLSQDGDLSGNLEFTKEELELLQKQAQESATPDKSDELTSNREKSVLEELDDLL
jgi:hypothetical protein